MTKKISAASVVLHTLPVSVVSVSPTLTRVRVMAGKDRMRG